MRRYLLGGLLLLASSTGCRMCCCPYDDCYPVVESYPMHGGSVDQGAVEQGPVENQGDAAPVEEQQSMRQERSPHLARPNRAPQQESY
jgi:hypothetical protein